MGEVWNVRYANGGIATDDDPGPSFGYFDVVRKSELDKLQSELAELNKDYKLLVEIHDKDFKQVLKLDQELTKSRELVGRLEEALSSAELNVREVFMNGSHGRIEQSERLHREGIKAIRAALELIGGKKNEIESCQHSPLRTSEGKNILAFKTNLNIPSETLLVPVCEKCGFKISPIGWVGENG